jgi:hypothetical protein
MQKSKRFWLALFLAAVVGCGGGGGGGPTAPPQPTANRQVVIAYAIETSGRASTMQEVNLLWDDRVVGSYSGAPTNALAFTPILNGVAPGSHSLTLRIARQTRSPTTYHLFSTQSIVPNTVVINAPGRSSEIINLPRDTVSLRTGDSRRYEISVP